MIPVELYDAKGGRVELVLIPPSDRADRPGLLAWGSRFFVRGVDDQYQETPCLQVFTAREHKAMAK
jgi:hypothetical protein